MIRTLVPLAVCLLVVAAGCKKGKDNSQDKAAAALAAAPGSGAGYTEDIAALCDVIARSAAPDDDSRTMLIANWLAANLKTPESRQFLVRIQPLMGNEKADALEAEAKRVGLSGCALAAEWRGP